ncbi:MAG TPA: ribonuclease P protein component [Lysobacter sp.]|nr:ribonuclease P protein component [Lysobacter sp.]
MGFPNDHRLPRHARVRARAEFDRVFERGKRAAHPLLALHWLPAPAPEAGARLGLAVSRKVDARAVARNRIKRVLRDAFRHQRARLAAGDYVLVARPAAREAAGDALREALAQLLRRVGALPPGAPAGTMPRASSPDSPSDVLPDSRPG